MGACSSKPQAQTCWTENKLLLIHQIMRTLCLLQISSFSSCDIAWNVCTCWTRNPKITPVTLGHILKVPLYVEYWIKKRQHHGNIMMKYSVTQSNSARPLKAGTCLNTLQLPLLCSHGAEEWEQSCHTVIQAYSLYLLLTYGVDVSLSFYFFKLLF